MPIQWVRLEPLSAAENAACTEYYSDATMLHACAQGWSGEFSDSARMQTLIGKLPQLINLLDSAIQKFELCTDATVYSGHGLGIAIVGSLIGSPQDFVGFKYRHAGYTSTTSDRVTAENFLRTRAQSSGARPVLLEFRLRKGQRILPLAAIGQSHEAEYLLGRSVEFEIKDAHQVSVQNVSQPALHLILGESPPSPS